MNEEQESFLLDALQIRRMWVCSAMTNAQLDTQELELIAPAIAPLAMDGKIRGLLVRRVSTAADLDICGSLETGWTQRDSSIAVKLPLEKESVSKLDRLSTLNARKASVFLDVAAASQMPLIAALLAWIIALILHARRKSSREFLRTWIALQACSTMPASATQPARLIIMEPVLPAGPILQLDG